LDEHVNSTPLLRIADIPCAFAGIFNDAAFNSTRMIRDKTFDCKRLQKESM
jgi:hypothetical protein